MKAEFTTISDIRGQVAVELPQATVEAEIERLSQRYRRTVRVPGFRPGKAPLRLIRQRLGPQLLQEAAERLVPETVDKLLREREIQPVGKPEVRDVRLDEGRPLTFTATFETLPEVDPGDCDGLTLRRTPIEVTESQIDEALQSLRTRAAAEQAVEDRGAMRGDILTVDVERRVVRQPAGGAAPAPAPESRSGARLELGATDNPPGFDEHLTDATAGTDARFTVTEPSGADVEYHVHITAIHERVLPDLDDDFAQRVSDHQTLDDLRAAAAADLRAGAEREGERRVRDDLLSQLARRLAGDVPEALVDREIDRRMEGLARGLAAQGVDPARANIDWNKLREGQREPAVDTVKSALVLDAIARRESIEATAEAIDQEIEQLAQRAGRGPAAMRALLEKQDGLASLAAGMRREQTIGHLLARATIVEA